MSSFSAHRRAQKAAREQALRAATPNPAKAVEKSSFNTETSSAGTGTPPRASNETSDQTKRKSSPRNKTEKGKEKLGGADKGKHKRGREENDEPARKKAHSSIPPVPPTSALPSSASAETPVANPPCEVSTSKASWLEKGFRLPETVRGFGDLAKEIQSSAPVLKNLHLSDMKTARFIGTSLLTRCMDSDTLNVAREASTGVDNTVGMLGAHLSQMAAYAMHLGRMASSANASKKMVIGLEKKNAELEGKLLSNKESLNSVELRAKSAKEKAEADRKESADLALRLKEVEIKMKRVEAKLEDLKKKSTEIEVRHSERLKKAVEETEYYRSAEYTAKVIDVFRQSSEYTTDLYDIANIFFDRGCSHIIRQFHQFIPDKQKLCEVVEGSYADFEFRTGCDFVPFTPEELQEIDVIDKEGVWNHPPPAKPTFFDQVLQFRQSGRIEGSSGLNLAADADVPPTPVNHTSTDQNS